MWDANLQEMSFSTCPACGAMCEFYCHFWLQSVEIEAGALLSVTQFSWVLTTVRQQQNIPAWTHCYLLAVAAVPSRDGEHLLKAD